MLERIGLPEVLKRRAILQLHRLFNPVVDAADLPLDLIEVEPPDHARRDQLVDRTVHRRDLVAELYGPTLRIAGQPHIRQAHAQRIGKQPRIGLAFAAPVVHHSIENLGAAARRRYLEALAGRQVGIKRDLAHRAITRHRRLEGRAQRRRRLDPLQRSVKQGFAAATSSARASKANGMTA